MSPACAAFALARWEAAKEGPTRNTWPPQLAVVQQCSYLCTAIERVGDMDCGQRAAGEHPFHRPFLLAKRPHGTCFTERCLGLVLKVDEFNGGPARPPRSLMGAI